MMRLSDLEGMPVRGLDGRAFGRIFEVHTEQGRVTTITCGKHGVWERLTGREARHRISWQRVRKVGRDGIVVE